MLMVILTVVVSEDVLFGGSMFAGEDTSAWGDRGGYASCDGLVSLFLVTDLLPVAGLLCQ